MENVKHIILRNVKIIDSTSKYNGQKKDVLIIDGVIKKIDKEIVISDPFFEVKSKKNKKIMRGSKIDQEGTRNAI